MMLKPFALFFIFLVFLYLISRSAGDQAQSTCVTLTTSVQAGSVIIPAGTMVQPGTIYDGCTIQSAAANITPYVLPTLSTIIPPNQVSINKLDTVAYLSPASQSGYILYTTSKSGDVYQTPVNSGGLSSDFTWIPTMLDNGYIVLISTELTNSNGHGYFYNPTNGTINSWNYNSIPAAMQVNSAIINGVIYIYVLVPSAGVLKSNIRRFKFNSTGFPSTNPLTDETPIGINGSSNLTIQSFSVESDGGLNVTLTDSSNMAYYGYVSPANPTLMSIYQNLSGVCSVFTTQSDNTTIVVNGSSVYLVDPLHNGRYIILGTLPTLGQVVYIDSTYTVVYKETSSGTYMEFSVANALKTMYPVKYH